MDFKNRFSKIRFIGYALPTTPANPINTTVMDYGVEICLDHYDTRLRRNIDNKSAIIGGIHVQVIPSCGMQIIHSSVATDADGFVFNCDGEFTVGKKIVGRDFIDGVDCLCANYKNPHDSHYNAHTQLARVEMQARGRAPKAPNSTNATFYTLDEKDIAVIDVDKHKPSYLDEYFAGGAGEVHIYGLNTPYTLYPD